MVSQIWEYTKKLKYTLEIGTAYACELDINKTAKKTKTGNKIIIHTKGHTNQPNSNTYCKTISQ